ncbi:MAG: hypothetical protein KGH64_02670 [Candidatus Micrarchaeota archaeon]|nr:hypothetical protein [Candidatus Micrarchaeota archaeon]MDE1834216.1 hypothetical protein [Candidatus Micrarchaeota archaeon]MDE1859744.1 hypothetical protein [Candidatus Micrarchaeota archaeon]
MGKAADAPAWMICEDILTKAKDELVLEAMDILHEEIKAGHIDIKGYVAPLPDKSGEIQKDMFIINNLRMREQEITEQYSKYIEDNIEMDPERLERSDELKRFMLSVKGISLLMYMSEIVGVWADATGNYSQIDDPAMIISKTLKDDERRVDVLTYVLASSKFINSEALSDEETAILRRGLELKGN